MTAETLRKDKVVTLTYSLLNQSGEAFEQKHAIARWAASVISSDS